MIANQQLMKISELLELRKNQMLVINSEYQRGAVWTLDQKKKLIDSILRGYPIPIIYLHKISRSVAGLSRDDLEVIDGQQRLNAIYEYWEGAFSLYDPIKDLEKARFPAFIRDQPCPWAGQSFLELDNEFQNQFLDTKLIVAAITSADNNEARDLFVRLQGGSALNAQERRDAWPGGMTEFILRVGGKPEVPKYPGHRFFTEILKMKPGSDRGKTRQLAAQLFMLYQSWKDSGQTKLVDINASSINDFYYDNLDFDYNGEEAKRFLDILSKLSDIVGTANLPKLRGHDAIHAVLLACSLAEDYSSNWKSSFAEALDRFLGELAKAKKQNDAGEFSKVWTEYGQRTRVNSDRGDNILRRHMFYSAQMLSAMPEVKPLDPNRTFGDIERRILFYEQQGLCQVCKSEVAFDKMEVHHVDPHYKAGKTSLENGAIVHPHCHPKGADAVEKFSASWSSRLTS